MTKQNATPPLTPGESLDDFQPIRRVPTSIGRSWLGGRTASLFIAGVPTAIVVLAIVLSQIEPAYYANRVGARSNPQCVTFSNQFLNTVSRLIGDIQNSRNWEARFGEEQINAWLAHDFQQNHAAKSLPKGVSQPRVEVSGDQLQIAFQWKRGPISSVIQIGVRAWVPKRNLLCVELESVKAGMLPLPTTYTRKVIEEFVEAQNLDVSWKRNGRKLVALVDFDRGNRQVVLRQVDIKEDALSIGGLGGRTNKLGNSYAPAAN